MFSKGTETEKKLDKKLLMTFLLSDWDLPSKNAKKSYNLSKIHLILSSPEISTELFSTEVDFDRIDLDRS